MMETLWLHRIPVVFTLAALCTGSPCAADTVTLARALQRADVPEGRVAFAAGADSVRAAPNAEQMLAGDGRLALSRVADAFGMQTRAFGAVIDLKALAETVRNLSLSPGLSDILLRPVASQVPLSSVAMFPAHRAASSSSWRTTEEMRRLVGFATETEPDLDEGRFIDVP